MEIYLPDGGIGLFKNHCLTKASSGRGGATPLMPGVEPVEKVNLARTR
jgi:hypothetical protein